jgi:hypothetical protein
LLPSEPVRITAFALVAVTVRVEDFPAAIEAGLAAMVTVAAEGGAPVTVTVAVPEACPPAPVAWTV